MPRTNLPVTPIVSDESISPDEVIVDSSAPIETPVVVEIASPVQEVAPQVIEYPIGFRPLDSIPEFLDAWVPAGIVVSPEALGAFRFFAKQQDWFADTPSGWLEKFSRWETNT